MRDRSATPIRMGIRRVSVIEAYGDHGVKLSLHRPRILVCGLALLIAACGMLLSTQGPRRPRTAGPCWSRTSIRVAPRASPPTTAIGLPLQRGRAHRRPRDPLLQRQRRQARLRALAKRRHGARGRGWSRTSTPAGAGATSTGSRPSTDRLLHGRRWRPRARALAKRRHGAGDEDGQGHQPRSSRGARPRSRTSTAPSTSPLSTAPSPGYGEVTAPPPGRVWSRGPGRIFPSSTSMTPSTSPPSTASSDLWRSDGTERDAWSSPPSSGPGPHRLHRHSLLQRRRSQEQRALAERWHRGGTTIVKDRHWRSGSPTDVNGHPLLPRVPRTRPHPE